MLLRSIYINNYYSLRIFKRYFAFTMQSENIFLLFSCINSMNSTNSIYGIIFIIIYVEFKIISEGIFNKIVLIISTHKNLLVRILK